MATMQTAQASFLLASAGNVIRVRRSFGLGGAKFPNVIQFISRACSICGLRGKHGVIAARVFLVPIFLGGSRGSIQASEPTQVDFERGFKYVLRFLRLACFEQQATKLFANRNKRSWRNRMFAQDVFRVRSATQYLDRFALLAFACRYPGGSRLHLQIEVVFKIVELGILRRVTQLLHSDDCFPRPMEIAGMRSSQRVTIFDQSFHEWERRPVR